MVSLFYGPIHYSLKINNCCHKCKQRYQEYKKYDVLDVRSFPDNANDLDELMLKMLNGSMMGTCNQMPIDGTIGLEESTTDTNDAHIDMMKAIAESRKEGKEAKGGTVTKCNGVMEKTVEITNIGPLLSDRALLMSQKNPNS